MTIQVKINKLLTYYNAMSFLSLLYTNNSWMLRKTIKERSTQVKW